MPTPTEKYYDNIHRENLDRYAKEVRAAYLKLIKEVEKRYSGFRLDTNNNFFFSNNKTIEKEINELIKALYFDVYGSTVTNINNEWQLAVDKHNEIATAIYGKKLSQLPEQYKKKIFSTNDKARKAFIERKINGLDLSDRVWRNCQQVKQELELALELTINNGKSAASAATEIKQYLNEPDKLFRRVRDKESGLLRLSKAAKAYNPGAGIYRSSYKNAERLTRNETNFSYEKSQKDKRAQQSFIVGIRIQVSPNHNPLNDKGGISCLSLQGDYPKDFDFTNKWHPNCLCQSYSILKTDDEIDKDTDLILSGKEPDTKSVNEVSKKPNNYNSYISENVSKWDNYKNKPRFYTNNLENK